MVTIFWNASGILEHGKTINGVYCASFLGETPKGDHSKKVRKIEERCSSSPGQCYSTQ